MANGRCKGFKYYKDRHGKARCYHRKSGLAIDLTKHPVGSVTHWEECQRIVAAYKLKEIEKEKVAPKTLGYLMQEFLASHEFASKADLTRRDYNKAIQYLRPMQHVPIRAIDRPTVVKIRDKAFIRHKRWFANSVRATLSTMFNWGLERGITDYNPVEGIKKIPKPRDERQVNRRWTAEECEAVLKAADAYLVVPIAIAMYIGLRQGDIVRMKKDAIKDGTIYVTTSKTGSRVFWPIPKVLKIILDNCPPHNAITLTANSYGRPWTQNALNAKWQRLKKELEKSDKIGKGLTFHGLRHTAASVMCELGVSYDEIADALGQSTAAMARHYARDANKKRTMEKIVGLMDGDIKAV